MAVCLPSRCWMCLAMVSQVTIAPHRLLCQSNEQTLLRDLSCAKGHVWHMLSLHHAGPFLRKTPTTHKESRLCTPSVPI